MKRALRLRLGASAAVEIALAVFCLVGCEVRHKVFLRLAYDAAAPDGASPAVLDAGRVDGASRDAAAPGPRLVARYRCDDLNGGTLADSSGNSLHGTCEPASACPALAPGVLGRACDFDGVDDAVVTAFEPLLNSLEQFTLTAWIQRDREDRGTVVAKPLGDEAHDSWKVFLDNAYLSVQAWDPEIGSDHGVGVGHMSLGYDTWPLDAWGQVWVWHTGENLGLHRGPQRVGNNPSVPCPTPTYDAHGLVIGADLDNNSLALHLDGRLDEIRLYDQVIDLDTLARLAQCDLDDGGCDGEPAPP